ncbi:MAG: hypothetical protein J6Q22_11040 [Prevotella sp.]|nr:hypothetical protein [Prevotella sp.]
MNAYEQMRRTLEALSNAAMVVLLCNGDEDAEMSHLSDCMDNAKAALSAPPRQCDVGTEEEQAERQKAYCRKHFTPDKLGGNCRKCPLRNRRGWSCQLAWAQMPYAEEGVAK